MGRRERQSSGFRDQLSVRQAHGAGAASAIPLPASRCIGCSMECTLYRVHRAPPVQQLAAGLAAADGLYGRLSYAELQPSELANDNFNSARARRAFLPSFEVSSEERGQPTRDCHGRQDKAGFPASGTSFLSFCLHIVFFVLRRSVEMRERRFFRLLFFFNAPRAAARDMLQIGDGRIFTDTGIFTLHHADCISDLAR
jgi:hypothetical protein